MTEMQSAHTKVIEAMEKLSSVWNEEEVERYPSYLPSFDDFSNEFSYLLNKGGTGINIEEQKEYALTLLNDLKSLVKNNNGDICNVIHELENIKYESDLKGGK